MKFKLFTPIVAILFLFIGIDFANADVISQHTFLTGIAQTNPSPSITYMGTGLQGLPYNVELKARRATAGTSDVDVTILCYTDSSYTIPCSPFSTVARNLSHPLILSSVSTTTLIAEMDVSQPMISTNYYRLDVSFSGAGTEYLLGDWNSSLIYYIISDGNNFNTTRINWISPIATTTSRTINFSFEYYLNTDTDPFDVNGNILLNLCSLSYPNEDCQHVTVTTDVQANILSVANVIATTTRDGFYLGTVNFWNGVSENVDECSWWDFGCEPSQIILGKGTSSRFNVATTTISADIPVFIDGIQSMCDDTDNLAWIFCKTIVFLFVPSPDGMLKFQEINNVLRQKIPFNYVYYGIDTIQAVRSATIQPGTDVVVDLNGSFLPPGSTTMFSFSEVKTELAGYIDSRTLATLTNFLVLAVIFGIIRNVYGAWSGAGATLGELARDEYNLRAEDEYRKAHKRGKW